MREKIDKMSRVIFYTLLFILPFCNRRLPVVGGFLKSDIVLFGLFIVSFSKVIFIKCERDKIKRFLIDAFKSSYFLCLMAVAIAMAISIGYSGAFKILALKETIRFCTYIILSLVCAYDFSEGRDIRRIFDIIKWTALIQCCIGIIQIFSDFLMLPEFSATTSNYTFNKIHGTFSNPNTFAAFLVIAFFPVLISSLREIRSKKECYRLIIPILILINITVTMSRNGLMGIVTGIIFLGVVYHKKLIYFVFAGGTVCATFLLSSRKFIDMAQDDFRISIWKYAFKMIKDNPIKGIGNGCFREMYNIYRSKYPHISVRATLNMPPHNSFLKVWCENGIFVLVLFIGAMCVCGKWILDLVKIKGNEERVFFIGIGCSFFAFMVMNLSDDLFFIPKLTSYFWVFAALIWGNMLRRK